MKLTSVSALMVTCTMFVSC